jgi:beta-glucosidase-like glycosyl hydrolase
MCIKEGKPAQIMCAYNEINGVPACLHSDLINGLARGRWGFDGLVVSDEDGIANAYKAQHYCTSQAKCSALGVKSGCDQNAGKTYAYSLADALAASYLNISDIDVALSRILRQRFIVGYFDPAAGNPYRAIPPTVMESPSHLAVSLAAAREAVVLLANNPDPTTPTKRSTTAAAVPADTAHRDALPNPLQHTSPRLTLPLKSKALKVGLIGPFGNNSGSPYGGKPDYFSSFTITQLDGIKAALDAGGGGGSVTFLPGCNVQGTSDPTQLAAAIVQCSLAPCRQ